MRERIVALIILALAATACGTAPGLAPVGSSGGPSSAGGFAVPTVPGQQLAAGMIKLDGTPRDLGTPGTPGAFFRNGGSGARGAFAIFIPPTVVDGIIQWLQKKASSS